MQGKALAKVLVSPRGIESLQKNLNLAFRLIEFERLRLVGKRSHDEVLPLNMLRLLMRHTFEESSTR